MPTITVSPARVQIGLTWVERVFGLLRDLDVPVSAVRSATFAPDALEAAGGLRAPGLGLPGIRKIGTWRRRGEKTFVSVRRGEPALVLELTGTRFDRVVVGTPRAREYVDELTALGVGGA